MPSSISSSRRFVQAFLAGAFVLTFGFATASEYLIRTRVEPHHNYYKYLHLFRTSKAVDTIFGDSHPAYGIAGINGFINLAHGGDGFMDVREKVRLYYAERRPGRVILQAGPHHFSRAYQLWRRDEAFVRALRGIETWTPRLLLPIHRTEIFGYWELWLAGRSFAPRHPMREDGSYWVDGDFATYPEADRIPGARRFAYMNEPLADLAASDVARAYAETIEFLVSGGGRVCLVALPITQVLDQARNGRPRYAEARRFLRRLADEKGVRYVDLLDRPLPDQAFSDFDHLNHRGAQMITPEIVERCFSG